MLSERERHELQNKKCLFDASQDPRNYTENEINDMSNLLMDVWSHGSRRRAKLTGMDYTG